MSQLQELEKRIKATLDIEKKNLFKGHHDESNLQGWIESLEYCIREIENIKGGH